MVVYKYKAMSFEGKARSGSLAADSKEEFLSKLRADNMYCLSYVSETQVEKVVSTKVKLKDLLFFCQQMAAMLKAGMTVVKALDIVRERTTDAKLRKLYLRVYENVQKGQSFSGALELEGATFPKLMISMVKYGELSGTIDQAMQKMASNFEKEAKLKRQIKGATTYPMVVGIVGIIVVIALMVFVLPNVTNMVGEGAMPLPTKILLAISGFIIKYWYILLISVALIVIGWKALKKNAKFMLMMDKIKIKMPKIGRLNRTVATSRFARTLASLYTSGIPLLDSLQVSIKVCGNTYIEDCFKDVVVNIKQGMELSVAISQTKIFDSIFNSMVFIGEQSAALDTMLISTAEFYDNEADVAIKKLVTMIQPIMIVALALVVGFIMIGVLLPMYSVYQTL